MTDLFEHLETLPKDVSKIIDDHFDKPENQGMNYKGCETLLKQLEPLGYTFDYGLDGEPHSLTKL